MLRHPLWSSDCRLVASARFNSDYTNQQDNNPSDYRCGVSLGWHVEDRVIDRHVLATLLNAHGGDRLRIYLSAAERNFDAIRDAVIAEERLCRPLIARLVGAQQQARLPVEAKLFFAAVRQRCDDDEGILAINLLLTGQRHV